MLVSTYYRMKCISNQKCRQHNTRMECPRIIHDAFLPKRTLLIATNTCFIQKRLQTPGDYFSSPNLSESRLKGKGISITSMSPSFNRGLCETRFITSVFLDPPKTWFQNKINKELPEARVTDRESAEAHVKLSQPVNRPKPFLKRKVSQIIMKCIFGQGIVVNAFRCKMKVQFIHKSNHP